MLLGRLWTGFLVRLAGGAAACVSTSVGHVTLWSLQVSPGKPTRNLDIEVFPLALVLFPFNIYPSSFYVLPFVGRPDLLQVASLHRYGTAYASDRIRHSWGIACGIPRATFYAGVLG